MARPRHRGRVFGYDKVDVTHGADTDGPLVERRINERERRGGAAHLRVVRPVTADGFVPNARQLEPIASWLKQIDHLRQAA